MTIQPLRPLALPAILLTIFILMAIFIPDFKRFDAEIIRIIQMFPRSWESFMIVITKLGDVIPLVSVAAAVSLVELLRRHYVRALVMVGSLIAMPAFYLVKETVQRVRPVTDFVIEHGLQGYSFPSGHATGTMAVYGMILLLAYNHLRGLARVIVVSACALIIVMVSFSRVYLGAHFPTDIISGWLLAISILSLLRTLSLYLARRDSRPDAVAIEDTTEAPESITN